MYYQNLSTIGGASNTQAALGIVSKYSYLIVKPHTSGELTKLIEIVEAAKRQDTNFKVYGYTSLGDQSLYSDWTADVDQWVTDLGVLLDGIYIDNFGFDQALATRANQNAAVAYVHGLTVPRPVIVSATNSLEILENYPSMAASTIGASSTIKDGILLKEFYFTAALTDPPTEENKKSVQGRIKYLKAARASKNLMGFVSASSGTATTVPQADYSNILNLVNKNFIEGLAVSTPDYSATATTFFFRNKANQFSLY